MERSTPTRLVSCGGKAAELIAPFSPDTYEELWIKAYAWQTGQWDHKAFADSPVPRQVEDIVAEALKIVPGCCGRPEQRLASCGLLHGLCNAAGR